MIGASARPAQADGKRAAAEGEEMITNEVAALGVPLGLPLVFLVVALRRLR